MPEITKEVLEKKRAELVQKRDFLNQNLAFVEGGIQTIDALLAPPPPAPEPPADGGGKQ